MLPIITSLFDFDLYKPTAHQVIFNRFPNMQGEYSFTCRNKDEVELLKYVPIEQLQEQIDHLANLRLSSEEYAWLCDQPFITPAYRAFLRNFRFNPDEHIFIEKDEKNRTYKITAHGPMIAIMLYETMILCIVNELFAKNYTSERNWYNRNISQGGFKLIGKIGKLLDYNEECTKAGHAIPQLIEFGTRRRYSAAWQEQVLLELKESLPNLIGTSNLHLAIKHGLKPIGTFGHEYMMALQGVYPIQHSQKRGLEIWLDEYRGAFGIALSDTLGDNKFDKDFDLVLAKAYDGTRHDSGDPFVYGERRIAHYNKLGINPATKKIVFSDGLDFATMIELHRHFRGRIQMAFGIGTNLTNDVGVPVLQIVMKLVKSNGQPVAKLSANPSKASCKDTLYLEYVRHAVKNF